MSLYQHVVGILVVRRSDYLFLALIAFAAALASAPKPRIPTPPAESWLISDADRQALTQLDPTGTPIHP